MVFVHWILSKKTIYLSAPCALEENTNGEKSIKIEFIPVNKRKKNFRTSLAIPDRLVKPKNYLTPLSF